MKYFRLPVLAILLINAGGCAIVQEATSPQNIRQESIKSCYRGNGDWDYEHNYCKYNPFKNAGDTEWKKKPTVSKEDKIKLPPLWR